MKAYVGNTLRSSVSYVRDLTHALEDDEIARRPCTEGGIPLNPPAWIIGHIAVTLSAVAERLGGQARLPEDWHTRFASGATPSDNAEDYPSKQELLEKLQTTSDLLEHKLDQADEGVLSTPMPEPYQDLMPTVGDAVVFMVLHTSIHAGQLTDWRRAFGMAPRF